MKVKIVALGKGDAWYPQRKEIIGNIGEFNPIISYKGGFRSGDFLSDEPIHAYGTDYAFKDFVFAYVKVHKL